MYKLHILKIRSMMNKFQRKEVGESNNAISEILEKKNDLLIIKFKALLNKIKKIG